MITGAFSSGSPTPSRRGFLAGAASLGALACASPALALPGAPQQLAALCDRLWQDQLRRSPTLATQVGADSPALRARLDDWSRGARQDWIGDAAAASRRLALIDAEILDQPLRIDHAVLSDHFGRLATLGRRWKFGDGAPGVHAPVAPYAVSPVNGPHRAVPRLLATAHPIGSAGDAEAWLTRLAQFPAALDAATAAFLGDAAQGIMAPAAALDTALGQLAALRQPDPATHPLATTLAARTAAAGLPGEWSARAAAILAKSVYPALDRQAAALARLRPAAPAVAGASQLPDGAEFYADALAWHTGTAITPAEAHRMGLDRIARLSAELDPVLRRLGFTSGTVGERLSALGRRPDEQLTDCDESRAAVVRAFADALAGAHPHLSAEFPLMPLPPREVRRLPAALEPLGAPDPASTRGTVYVDTANLAQWPRYAIPTSAFREGLPAPAWEAACAAASPELPAIRRHGTRYPAHGAGWTPYAEAVATRCGLYADDLASRAGYLQARLLGAARLVADTGLHAKGWSAAEAARFIAATAGRPADLARGDIARAALLPGQACAEAVGEGEWLRLRALAQRLSGAAFDPQRFNGLIGHGRAPFAVLEQVVTETFSEGRSVLAMRTA